MLYIGIVTHKILFSYISTSSLFFIAIRVLQIVKKIYKINKKRIVIQCLFLFFFFYLLLVTI